MKKIVPALLIVIPNTAILALGVTGFVEYIALFSLILGLLLLLSVFIPLSAFTSEKSNLSPKPAVAEAVKPAPAAPSQNQAQAEVVTLLGVFQEKGRFIDFLMEDITPYDDSQVGQVARAVHQGCKAALNEHFHIEPISPGGEGASITVPVGYAADEFRLVGNLAGEAPFTGKLVHQGWRTTSVKLPRVLKTDHLPAIAPAQVEVG